MVGFTAAIFQQAALMMIPPIDAFPSSEAFDAINSSLQSSDAERKNAMKQGNAVFAFTLKNKAGETESWHIDLKNKGEVGKGLGDNPSGEDVSSSGAKLLLDASSYVVELEGQ